MGIFILDLDDEFIEAILLLFVDSSFLRLLRDEALSLSSVIGVAVEVVSDIVVESGMRIWSSLPSFNDDDDDLMN